jgi:hypothetical protein
MWLPFQQQVAHMPPYIHGKAIKSMPSHDKHGKNIGMPIADGCLHYRLSGQRHPLCSILHQQAFQGMRLKVKYRQLHDGHNVRHHHHLARWR